MPEGPVDGASESFNSFMNALPEIENVSREIVSQSHFLVEYVANFSGFVNQRLGSLEISSAELVLLAAGITIFLGVAGESFFRKTGIPDLAFLMMFGVIIGPVLGLISPDTVLDIVPYFSAIALIIIMYDGGLHLDIRKVIKTAHFALLITVAGFVASALLVSSLAVYVLGWEWMPALLLGTMVGGSSSAIVFGLVRNITISEETKSMLSLESAMTDIMATIAAFALIGIIISGQFNTEDTVFYALRSVMVGTVLGLGVGIPWMYITAKLEKERHAFMLTLGVLFALYFVSNQLGESGALTALVFGLMVGNRRYLSRILKFKLPEIHTENSFHGQLTFLVRTFFFVFVGLLASFGQLEYVVFGIAVTIFIFIIRTVIVKVSLTKRFTVVDKMVTSSMFPRGLASAVLATIPLTAGIPNAQAYPQIVFFIILSSIIITTIGVGRAKKKAKPVGRDIII